MILIPLRRESISGYELFKLVVGYKIRQFDVEKK